MRASCLLIAALSLAASGVAQTTSDDVGLTLGGASITTSIGQICGPVPCQALPGTGLSGGTTYYLVQDAAAFAPFAIAFGAPTTQCVTVPGIANALTLGTPLAIFAGGVTGPPVPVFPCPRGVATVPFTLPPNTPVGIAFHVQSVSVDWAGQLAFSPAIALVTQ